MIESLQPDARLQAYEAIIDYGLHENLPKGIGPMAMLVFNVVKDRMDYDTDISRKRSEAGKKGGAPKGNCNAKKQAKQAKTSKNKQKQANSENVEMPENKGVSESVSEKITDFCDITEETPPLPLDKETPPTPPIEINPPISPKEEVHTPQEIVEFYNEAIAKHNSKMSKCIKLTDKRKQLIRARMGEYTIEQIHEAITKVAVSAFCNGKGSTGWVAGFDFIFNVNNMPKILEGAYDNRQAPNDTRLFTNNPDKFKQSFW